MPIGRRATWFLAGTVLATGAAFAALRLPERRAVDPCLADPGAYACAVFSQPDWMRQRVYAGRMDPSPPAPAPALRVEAAAAPDVGETEAAVDGI